MCATTLERGLITFPEGIAEAQTEDGQIIRVQVSHRPSTPDVISGWEIWVWSSDDDNPVRAIFLPFPDGVTLPSAHPVDSLTEQSRATLDGFVVTCKLDHHGLVWMVRAAASRARSALGQGR